MPAAVLVLALLLGGGYLLVERLRDNDGDDGKGGKGGAANPAVGIVPDKFIGTWVGERKTTDGIVTTVTLTIAQSAQDEEKSGIRAETPKTGIWCEGKWKLSSVKEDELSYAARTTDSSPGAECITDRSTYRLITMRPDGTLRYTMDLMDPDQYIALRKLR
ncbi:hypothetical protein GCM10009639_50150 [Kitasatospora putterlickiae]|uniref:Uncharacterized protein n=1 Tax=Kitasatospora putterlickiae TaxID=221725 RepID=A0ABN1YEA8_9ACTN